MRLLVSEVFQAKSVMLALATQKRARVTPIFLSANEDKPGKMQLLSKFKELLLKLNILGGTEMTF